MAPPSAAHIEDLLRLADWADAQGLVLASPPHLVTGLVELQEFLAATGRASDRLHIYGGPELTDFVRTHPNAVLLGREITLQMAHGHSFGEGREASQRVRWVALIQSWRGEYRGISVCRGDRGTFEGPGFGFSTVLLDGAVIARQAYSEYFYPLDNLRGLWVIGASPLRVIVHQLKLGLPPRRIGTEARVPSIDDLLERCTRHPDSSEVSQRIRAVSEIRTPTDLTAFASAIAVADG